MPEPTVRGDQTPEGTPLPGKSPYDHRGQFEPDDELDGPGPRATTTAPVPAERPEPKPPPRVVSRALAQLAADLGFTDAEIAGSHPAALERAVLMAQSDALAESRSNRLQELPARQPQRPPEPPAEPELELEGEVEETDPETGAARKRKVTEKDYDPNIVKLLKGQRKQIAELGAALKDFREADAARTRSARDDVIDAAFDSLDPRLKKLLGSGPGVRTDAKSVEFRRRVAVLGTAGCDFNNDTPAALREKITRGAAELYGLAPAADAGAYDEIPDEPATPAKDPETGRFLPAEADEDRQVADRRAAWADAPLPRPTARVARELPRGEKKAAATANAMLREMYPDAEYDAPIGIS